MDNKLNTLSSDVRAAFAEDGYVVLPAPFLTDVHERIMALVAKSIDETHADGLRRSSIDPRLSVLDTNPLLLSLLEHQSVVSWVKQLLDIGPFRVCHANFNNRSPWAKPWINWHTDYRESERVFGPRIEVGWYLTQTTRENGYLRVIPGSHRLSFDIVRQELMESSQKCQSPVWRQYLTQHPRERELILGPNDILLRDGFLWHTSSKNTTNQNRYLYTWSYCSLADPVMNFDYQLLLPREIVESPSTMQSILFSLDHRLRERMKDRYDQPVKSISERMGYTRDCDWRASSHYKNAEEVRFADRELQ